MVSVTPAEFEQIVAEAIDSLPKHIEHTNNVVIVSESSPSEEQRQKLKLRPDCSLFGLYEGIPLTKRGTNYNMVLPDKITIFQQPLEAYSRDLNELRARVKRTVWHEIAHHYGLDHDRINQLQEGRE